MITLSNNHRFEYMVASGALAYDGRGWPWEWPLRWVGLLDPSYFTIVTKSLTRLPRRGNLRWWNPCGVVRLLPGGVVNAVGLTNPGIDWWCASIGPRVGKFSHKLIVSLHAESAADFSAMASLLTPFPIVGIELNFSCPNTSISGASVAPSSGKAAWSLPLSAPVALAPWGGEPSLQAMADTDRVCATVAAVRAATHHPLIIKLAVTHDYAAIARQTQGQASAIAINSVPWALVHPGQPSPLAHFGGGGVSGRIAQSHTWRMLQELVENTSTPIIGPSVWEFDDLARLRRLGAAAISFGSIFLRYPWRPTQFVRREQRERSCATR